MRDRHMEREDFEAVADFIGTTIQLALQKGLDVRPMLFGLAVDAKHKVEGWGVSEGVDVYFTDDAVAAGGKAAAEQLLLKMTLDPRVDVGVLVFRAWVVPESVHLPTPEQAHDVSKHPDARDGFIAALRTQDYGTIAMYEYNEPERSIIKIPLRWDGPGWSGRYMHRSRDQSLN